MHRLIGCIATIIGCIAMADALKITEFHDWVSYKLQYSKRYANFVEDARRMNIFLSNKKTIGLHNQLFQNGGTLYEMGLNQYSDLSHEEFVAHMNGLKRPANDDKTEYFNGTNDTVPRSIDWRDYGAVTDVKDQGYCGACWAFSSNGALESQNFRKTGELVSLSEQNLIDCSSAYGTNGCKGGWMNQAFKYIKENGGIDTEKSYPYEANSGDCKYTVENSGCKSIGFVGIPEGDEDKLQEAVAIVGPIAVAIDASRKSFQHYKSGIYDDPGCSKNASNHGVLVVGYGFDAKNNDYYIVKNSFGKTWGENGYIKMPRNQENHCGIATAASYPIV